MNTHPHYLYNEIVNSIKNTKVNLLAMTGLQDGTIGYAIDTEELGTYSAISNSWTWLGSGGGSAYDDFWTSGSAGLFSLRAKNNTTIDAVGDYSFAIGRNTYASGSYSRAEGNGAVAVGSQSHAEGSATEARGAQSHSEGLQSIAFGSQSHAEGIATIAYGQASHAEGNASIASGTNSFANGQSNAAIGINSAAFAGRSNRVLGNNSVILGGSGTVGVYDDTVFVPNLNIRFVQTGTPLYNLGADVNGNVVIGITGTSSAGTPIFQRNLSATLTLSDGESLVTSEYVNAGTHDIILQGDSNLRIV